MSVDKCMQDRPKDGTDGEVCLVASRKSSRRMPKSPRACQRPDDGQGAVKLPTAARSCLGTNSCRLSVGEQAGRVGLCFNVEAGFVDQKRGAGSRSGSGVGLSCSKEGRGKLVSSGSGETRTRVPPTRGCERATAVLLQYDGDGNDCTMRGRS